MKPGLLVLAALVGPTLTGACGKGERRSDRTKVKGDQTRSSRKQAPSLRVGGASELPTLMSRLVHAGRESLQGIVTQPVAGSTADGVTQLLNGKAPLCLVTRTPTKDEARRLKQQGITAVALGFTPVAVLANRANPMDRISLTTLAQVLSGKLTNWRELVKQLAEASARGISRQFVEKSRTLRLTRRHYQATLKHLRARWRQHRVTAYRVLDLKLVPYTLPRQSSVAQVLEQQLLGGRKLHVSVRTVGDQATIIESVKRTPGGLALLALENVAPKGRLPAGLKVFALSKKMDSPAYLPTDRAALRKGQYPLHLPVVLLARAPRGSPAARLLGLLAQKSGRERADQLGLVFLPDELRDLLQRMWQGESQR